MLTVKDTTPSDAGEVVFTIKDLCSKATLTIEGMYFLLEDYDYKYE